ncbi:MAG: class I SAM-dependent methyltransferase [Tabrizicola sp.]|nr:class I SAM-dependent methyltransferase [Tabrizicola sp.]
MTEALTKHYRHLLLTHGDSAEAAQYSSRESQFRRFAALARVADLRGKRVLDFGCGTASFAEYLLSIDQMPAHYHGVDIMTDFFEYAREKVPGGRFSHPDELGDERFDFAFVSGVFNNRRKGNRKFWQQTVRDLFSRCDIGLSFNLMSTHVDYQDPGLFYEDPARAFTFVKREVTPFVTLCHDYLPKLGSIPFEFVIHAFRSPSDLKI